MVPEILRKSEGDEGLMMGQLKHAWEPLMRELYGCEGRFDGRLLCDAEGGQEFAMILMKGLCVHCDLLPSSSCLVLCQAGGRQFAYAQSNVCCTTVLPAGLNPVVVPGIS